ncbi:unnamed protein product, partial [Leptidea sinapis]
TWAVQGVLLNMFGQGLVLSYTSCLLPALQSPDSDIPLDLHMASWVASSIGLAGVPGFLISSILMDWKGRRKAHLIVLLPAILGWLIIYFASNISLILVGRLLGGFTCASTVCLGAVVIGEYTSPQNRGMFLNLKTAAVCMGNMTVHILGNFLHWRQIALIAVIPTIISFLITLTWPESPAWLASNREFGKCEKSFYWLREKSEESNRELEEMIRAQKERFSETPTKTTFRARIVDFLQKFLRRDFIRPVTIVFFAGMLLETCGRHLFPAYALQIVANVTGEKTNSFYFILAIDIIITTSALFASILVKVFKRRTLLFASGFSSLFILLTACLYLFLVSREIISKDYPWIPIVLFVMYFIISNLGCTPIPLALLGEVFPLQHRAAGAIVSGFILSFTLMFALQLTPYLMASVKVYGTFSFFGILMGISLGVLYFIMPETKDRTLQQIEDYFNHTRRNNVKDDVENVQKKMLSKNDN